MGSLVGSSPVSSALSLSFACCLLVYAMSGRGRSVSPRPIRDEDVDMDDGPANSNLNARVVIITNLTRNVLEPHLQTIFGFYGDIVKADVPLYAKCAYMLFL